ncbi:uncharacterized protein L3040_000399 [Drepanopeziza brunnea f. sp. 'multigermtubi']|uniref:Uncharacterized protein n=1 Tax=Marssonina brunnea f. sp. multigermtubi (strain MB_m1) TaxID=1072389 RepID=K1X8Q2_MARBU|nr:uncharacterized protein MBM_04650 [Drepanopeziza brunnea f. sp. 'multigermtubi' MB_m1]EKD17073.1 hypothetical protein MBM_04650 [Drepanopeziza brunnea f. sp. 'multigermtubi' MB_m1]KAJ5054116.1 hypothetical protein L3040_000399 [Drepanopeziza brunnea f. sp. 'multigermtubi']
MLLRTLPRAALRCSLKSSIRSISTLQSNSHIYAIPSPSSPNSHILSFLPTNPPTNSLAIGTTTTLPPTPASVTENPNFLRILYDVLRLHATSDPYVQGQAAAFASSSGSALGSGGMFFPQQQQQQRRRGAGGGTGQEAAKRGPAGDGAGGASSQGGAGGGGRGGWVHVSDLRAPPDYGRIAWPEDIFGSLEVDGRGEFVEGEGGVRGNWQESGSYRVVTREGILGLSDFLRGKLIERLREEEKIATR